MLPISRFKAIKRLDVQRFNGVHWGNRRIPFFVDHRASSHAHPTLMVTTRFIIPLTFPSRLMPPWVRGSGLFGIRGPGWVTRSHRFGFSPELQGVRIDAGIDGQRVQGRQAQTSCWGAGITRNSEEFWRYLSGTTSNFDPYHPYFSK